ncbi:gamma-glutamyl hydrolase [Thraustotheca clavata]|uniref:folate gamma-glutamyl hydrolase n=1 Tax=Thraustotheca clavata TaxID=74557 RepID=A0A1W0A434_9STRA|nr:gamma-glutamyl hydrolase [Thraustotheca clavata]
MADETTLPILAKSKPHRSFRCGLIIGILGFVGLMAFVSTNSKPFLLNKDAEPIATVHPIIGVLSHPIAQDEAIYTNQEYIAASYVKWIESAGGRVVRIPFTASKEELRRIVMSVNGVLFPGGDPDPNEQAKYLYDLAIEVNRNGTYFPLWGTCLGFEWLVQLTSNNLKILDPVDAQDVSSAISYTNEESRLFSFSPSFDALTKAPLSAYFHHLGITTEHFLATESLSSFYKATATSLDRNGVEYIAAIEAKEYPIYGIQFHPEKNPYELGELANGNVYGTINHSYEAIMAAQAFSHFFIREAKKNHHRFPTTDEEIKSILWNQATTNAMYPALESIYAFDPVN